jgi:hypothetical protein
VEDLFEGDAFLRGAVNVEGVAVTRERLEEREPLDVVPVGVGKEEVDGDGFGLRAQRGAERTKPTTGVENDELPASV